MLRTLAMVGVLITATISPTVAQEPSPAGPCSRSSTTPPARGIDPDELRCALAVATEELRDQVSRRIGAETMRQLALGDLKNARDQLTAERDYWKKWCGESPGCVSAAKQSDAGNNLAPGSASAKR